MCGITGFIAAKTLPASTIHTMTQAIRHRGPDDEGYLLFTASKSSPVAASGEDTVPFSVDVPWAPGISIHDETLSPVRMALGHRRLSIVDLSAMGHQPMSYADGRYWIAYNGEIYNYLELREELIGYGYKFITKSDTEVILAAYDYWGTDCQNHFNGMWALAIFDLKKQILFLSRDRFGIKPLYYWAAPDGSLFFGSEIKLFTVLPGWKAVVNAQRAYDYLVWGLMDHTDETMFEGVFQVPPGCFARVPLGQKEFTPAARLPMVRWYALTPQKFAGNYDDATRLLEQKLRNSIRMHLRSDVAVGSCLSGGIDSSAIVCMVNQELTQTPSPASQKTFSACSDVKAYDEQKWISQVVAGKNIDAHYTHPALSELFENTRKILWHQDEPFGSTSIYAQWKVFELAQSQNVRVLLDGQGADEQLAGYHTYYAVWFSHLFKRGKLSELRDNILQIKKMHGYSVGHAIARMINMMASDWLRNFMKRRMGKPDKNPAWLDIGKLGAKPVDPYIALNGYTDSIQSLSYSQLTKSHLQALLHWEDRDSMAYGVESRVPYLDHHLVEFTLGLPDEYKLSDGITKKVLRDSLSGIIPDNIRDRTDKLGFVTPEEVWVRETGTDLFRSKINQAIRSLDGIIKPQAIDFFDEIVSGQKTFNFALWRILNFAEWVDVFSVELPSSNRAIP